jgi:hypothetical protein
VGSLSAAGVLESSGVAVSRAYPDVLWTHNDSGNEPLLYAVDLSGRLLAVYAVVGARAVDWEDLSLGRCPARHGRGTCLFIGDIGDNSERRRRVTVYAVREPDPRGPGGARRSTEPAAALRISYADRPHDAEALAVSPEGTISIVSKGRSGPILRYEVPANAWGRDSITVPPRDTLPIVPVPIVGRWVTGGSIARDGRTAVLRTQTEIYFLRTGPRWTLAGTPCRLGFVEPQGEAVDFLDAERLVLTSERALGPEAPITVVHCR